MINIFDRPKNSTLHAEFKETAAGEHHVSNLYDENEDTNGDRVDLSTGEPIDNTTMPGDSDNRAIVSSLHLSTDNQAGDATDKWLQDNDPNYQG
jgi:hypothetical protein